MLLLLRVTASISDVPMQILKRFSSIALMKRLTVLPASPTTPNATLTATKPRITFHRSGLLLVLGHLVRKAFPRPVIQSAPQAIFRKVVLLHRELSQLVAHHVLRNAYVVVDLAVVHLKDQADKVGQDGRRSRLRLDGRDSLAGPCADDGKPTRRQFLERNRYCLVVMSYGTM